MLIDFGPTVEQPDKAQRTKQRVDRMKTRRSLWLYTLIFITSIDAQTLHLYMYFFSLCRPKYFLAFAAPWSKVLVKPFAPIFHTVACTLPPILALILLVLYATLSALTDGFTAPLPEFLTVFYTVTNVFPTILPPILSRLYALFHTKAFAAAFSGTQSDAPPSISERVTIQIKNLNVSILLLLSALLFARFHISGLKFPFIVSCYLTSSRSFSTQVLSI
jgi:hypothetical protein